MIWRCGTWLVYSKSSRWFSFIGYSSFDVLFRDWSTTDPIISAHSLAIWGLRFHFHTLINLHWIIFVSQFHYGQTFSKTFYSKEVWLMLENPQICIEMYDWGLGAIAFNVFLVQSLIVYHTKLPDRGPHPIPRKVGRLGGREEGRKVNFRPLRGRNRKPLPSLIIHENRVF